MSPHLQVWRWHVTMLTSILHRVTGVGIYLGALILAAWAISLAAGPEATTLLTVVLVSIRCCRPWSQTLQRSAVSATTVPGCG